MSGVAAALVGLLVGCVVSQGLFLVVWLVWVTAQDRRAHHFRYQTLRRAIAGRWSR